MWDDLAIVKIDGVEVFVNDAIPGLAYVRVKNFLIGMTSAGTRKPKIVVCAYAYDATLDIFMMKSTKVFEFSGRDVLVREIIPIGKTETEIVVNNATPGNAVTYERTDDFFVSVTSPKTREIEMIVCVSTYDAGMRQFVCAPERTFDLKERELVERKAEVEVPRMAA